MKRVAPILIASVLIVAAAGCVSEGGEGLEGSDTSTSGMPPKAMITSVSVDGNESVPENGSFRAAVGANITFDGSGSTGDGLSFGWDFGDGNTTGSVKGGASGAATGNASTSAPTGNSTGNGTSGTNGTGGGLVLLPGWGMQPNQTNATSNDTNQTMQTQSEGPAGSIVVYAYSAAGNYTVTLHVTDENDQTDTATVDMVITVAPGAVLREDTRQFSDSQACTMTDGLLGNSKTSTFEWIFNETEADGTPSVVGNVTITGGPEDTVFLGPDGEEIASGETIEAEGPFPAGTYTIEATSECSAGSTSPRVHELTATATYVAV